MPIDSRGFQLSALDVLGGQLRGGLQGGQLLQQAQANQAKLEQQRQLTELQGQATGEGREQALAQMAVRFPEKFEQVQKNLGLITQQQKDEASDFAFKLSAAPFEQREQLINERAINLESQGRNASDTRSLIGLDEVQQNEALSVVQLASLSAKERLDIASGKGRAAIQFGAQQTFKDSAGNLFFGTQKRSPTTGDVESVLSPIGGAPASPVGAINPVTSTGLTSAERIAEKAAIQAQVGGIKVEQEVSAQSRIDLTKQAIAASTAAFKKIPAIRKGITNIDRAIEAIDAGAKTGVVRALLPSVKTASIRLDQIANELGLDVVGSVTFGALSESELALAKATGLPTKLSPPELKTWLIEKKEVQEKLLQGLQDAAEFLGSGGTVAELVRQRREEADARRQTVRREEVQTQDLQDLTDDELLELSRQR